jgi:hypothetical protein
MHGPGTAYGAEPESKVPTHSVPQMWLGIDKNTMKRQAMSIFSWLARRIVVRLHSHSLPPLSVAACILAGARRIPFDVHSPCLLSRWPCFSTN